MLLLSRRLIASRKLQLPLQQQNSHRRETYIIQTAFKQPAVQRSRIPGVSPVSTQSNQKHVSVPGCSASEAKVNKQQDSRFEGSDAVMDAEFFEIDGSILEGGGQILRFTTALAAICTKPVKIDKIRLGRAKPGLKAQHLTGLKLVQRLCRGELTGGEVNSTSISLVPSTLVTCDDVADTRTAGSCTLMVQQSLPCLLYAAPQSTASTSHLELRGGTDADMAPPVGYLQYVLAPLLHRLLNIEMKVELVKRGFYPRGGGIIKLEADCLPANHPLPAFDLTQRGKLKSITIRAFAAGKVPRRAAERMAAAAKKDLRKGITTGEEPEVYVEVTQDSEQSANGNGSGVSIVAETDTGCVLGCTARGDRSVPDDATGSAAATELLEAINSGSCVDQWMQDQLIIFMALARGVSRILASELSLHTRTGMVICEQLLPACKFTVTEQPPQPGSSQGSLWLVECKGAGVVRAS